MTIRRVLVLWSDPQAPFHASDEEIGIRSTNVSKEHKPRFAFIYNAFACIYNAFACIYNARACIYSDFAGIYNGW